MAVVGILSDTHGALADDAYKALQGSDFIIHAGDICDHNVLPFLETIAPVYAVLGNNDYPEYGSDVRVYAAPVIEGVRFLVAHMPIDLLRALQGHAAGFSEGNPLPHIAVHGHTHIPCLETRSIGAFSGTWLCPGSVSRPRSKEGRTVAKAEIEGGRILDVRVETLSGARVLP